MVVDYKPRELLRGPLRLRGVSLRGVEIHARRGRPVEEDADAEPGVPFRPPRVTIDHVEVTRSFCEVSGPYGRLKQRLPRVDWTGSVASDSVLTVVSESSDIFWETRDVRIRDLQGIFSLDDERVGFSHASLLLNESPIQTDGSRYHDGRLALSVRGRDVRVSEIEDLIDMNIGFTARGDLEMDFLSRSDTLAMDVLFDGELEGFGIVGFSGMAELVPGSLDWSRMRGRIDGAFFDGSGWFDLRDTDDVVFQLTGDVSDVDISTGLVPAPGLPETDGWGWMELWRRDRTNDTMVSGWLADGRVSVVPFDTCWVDVEASDDGVRFNRLGLRMPAGEALVTGASDPDGAFAGELTVVADDLSRLPASWNLPPLTGRLVGGGALTGEQEVFDLRGEAVLLGADMSPLHADTCRIDFTVEDALGRAKVGFDAAGAGLTVAEVDLGDFRASGVATDEVARLHSFRSARGDTIVAFRGQATFSDSLTACYVPELEMNLEGTAWSLDDALRLAISPDVVSVEDVTLSSERGSISCGLISDRPAARLDGAVRCRDLDLALLNPFVDLESGLSGRVTADFRLAGSPDDPLIDVTADLVDCPLPLARIDSLSVDALLHGGTVTIDHLELLTGRGRVSVAGTISHPRASWRDFWPGAALDLELGVAQGDWSFIDQFEVPALDRIAGVFDADLGIGGTTDQPEISGEVVSAPFDIHWAHLDELSGRLAYGEGQLVLSGLEGRRGATPLDGRIEIPLRIDFLSEPVSPPEGPLYMRVTIPDGSDLAAMTTMTNAFIESGGRGGLDLVIAGPASHPRYSGRATVRDGNCVLRGLGEIYRDVSIDAEWRGDVLEITRIEGREGARGTFRGDGEVRFDGLELDGFDLRLAADRFLVASIPDLRALVRSSDLRLSGVKVGPDSLIAPRFSGAAEVIEARYTGDFSEKAGVSDPLAGTVAPDWLADLHLTAAPRTCRIVNKAMELYLGGDARLVRDLEGLYLRGSMNIDAGRLPVFNNDFRVTRGALDFSREVGVIPRIDMTAETQVRLPSYDGGTRRLEKIYVDVTGSVSRPVVDFRSESGYARSNIERMLLGLSPYATDTQTTAGLQTASVAAGFNMLEREIATELEVVDTFDIEGGRERVDGTTQTLIGVGKYIGRDLYIKYAQALTDPDRDFLVEYQISNHLLLQSEISSRRDEALGNTTYSVDLKYRFEY